MNELKEIEAKISSKKSSITIEEYIRFIEYKTVSKIDILFCGTFYRITGYTWNTENDCSFNFMFDSHKSTMRGALEELSYELFKENQKVKI